MKYVKKIADIAVFFIILGGVIIKELKINEEIREKKVRVIDQEGEQLGILPIEEAQKLAIEKGLDLAEVAPNGKPPVCRIMDYGKFRYEQQKKEKEAKKKQQVIKVKEIRLSPKIEDHDLGYKAKHAIEFLQNGDRVKVSVRFRGREMGHTELGREVLEKFAKETEEYSIIDKRPKMEGRQMIMFLSAKTDN